MGDRKGIWPVKLLALKPLNELSWSTLSVWSIRYPVDNTTSLHHQGEMANPG